MMEPAISGDEVSRASTPPPIFPEMVEKRITGAEPAEQEMPPSRLPATVQAVSSGEGVPLQVSPERAFPEIQQRDREAVEARSPIPGPSFRLILQPIRVTRASRQ